MPTRVSRDLDVRRPELLDVQRTGTVRWFKAEKGYGRITADYGEVLFVHFSDIVADGYRSLVADQRVDSSGGAGSLTMAATTPKRCACSVEAHRSDGLIRSRERIPCGTTPARP